MNKSPKHEKKKSLRNTAVAVVAAGAALTLAGCTTEAAQTPSSAANATHSAENTAPMSSVPTEQSSSVTISAPTETAKSQDDVNKEYMQSPERAATIGAAVTKAGERVVAAAESGELGRFAFYNSDTGDWGGEGWGYLQHNPQYGDSDIQVSTTVYRNGDGTYDVSKGIRGVQMSFSGTTNEKDLPGVSVDRTSEDSQDWYTSSAKFVTDDFSGRAPSQSPSDVFRYYHGTSAGLASGSVEAEDAQVLADLQAGMDETFGAGW